MRSEAEVQMVKPQMVDIAEKQRLKLKVVEQFLALIERIKNDKPLKKAEIAELKHLEQKYKAKSEKPKPKEKYFTVKQQRFIDAYDGDIKKASIKAKITYQYARKLATKSNIMAAIRHREDTEKRPIEISNRQDRQKFWSDAMNNTEFYMRDRLRASELLGKSEADFVDIKMDVATDKMTEEAAKVQIEGYRERLRESKEALANGINLAKPAEE